MIAIFDLPGPPLPWKRANSFEGRRFTPKEQRAYQRTLAFAFLAKRPQDWPLKARYALLVEATFTDHRWHDLDNMGKQVMDALNKVAWADDSQVDDLHVKRMPPSKTAPGLSVRIETIHRGEVMAA